MGPKIEPFVWDHKRRRAAVLVALDALPDAEIAQQCAIAKSTLERWKALPAFMGRVQGILEERSAAHLAGGLAERKQRVAYQEARHQALLDIVAERGADPSMRAVPGGTTGYLVRQTKMIGVGATAERLSEYAVDSGLLTALAAIEKQAAQEVGQWTEKREISGKDGGPVALDWKGFSDAELDVLERLRAAVDAAASSVRP
jgi:hypothetical protein